MDNRERDGRVELATAFRLAVRLGFHEGVCNHFSLALTDDGREFLVNPHLTRYCDALAKRAAAAVSRPKRWKEGAYFPGTIDRTKAVFAISAGL